jgi:hypothetical protein
MKNLFSLLLVLTLIACSEQKSTTTAAPAVNLVEPSGDEMAAEGFESGVIMAATDDSGCDYTIKTKNLTYLLDPTNLEKEFKENGLNVWFKYRPLRMQNRCPEATPVEVSEMRLRKK